MTERTTVGRKRTVTNAETAGEAAQKAVKAVIPAEEIVRSAMAEETVRPHRRQEPATAGAEKAVVTTAAATYAVTIAINSPSLRRNRWRKRKERNTPSRNRKWSRRSSKKRCRRALSV